MSSTFFQAMRTDRSIGLYMRKALADALIVEPWHSRTIDQFYPPSMILPLGSTVMTSSSPGLKGNCESLAIAEGTWMRNLLYSVILPPFPLMFNRVSSSLVVPFRTIRAAMLEARYKQL